MRCRENAEAELSSITATQDDQDKMRNILARVAASDDGGAELIAAFEASEASADALVPAASSVSEGLPDTADVGPLLSDATLQRLLAIADAGGCVEDIQAADLEPGDLDAFHRALAAGQVRSGHHVGGFAPTLKLDTALTRVLIAPHAAYCAGE